MGECIIFFMFQIFFPFRTKSQKLLIDLNKMSSQFYVSHKLVHFFSTDLANNHIPQPDRVDYGVEVTIVGGVVSGRQGAGSVDNFKVMVARPREVGHAHPTAWFTNL